MDGICSKWYNIAIGNLNSEKCLLYADSILYRGKAIKDKNAIICAKTIPVYYFSQEDDYMHLHDATMQLRQVLDKNKDYYAYFFSYNAEVINQLKFGHTLRALDLAKEMHQYAQHACTAYGKYAALQSLADIYFARCDYSKTVSMVDSSFIYLSEARKEVPQINVTNSIIKLAKSLEHIDSLRAINAYSIGYSEIKNAEDSLNLMLPHAKLCGFMGNKEEFHKLYEKITPLAKKIHLSDENKQELIAIKALKCTFKNEENEALKFAQNITNNFDRLTILSFIYSSFGNYKEAMNVEMKRSEIIDSIAMTLSNKDINQIKSILNNSELRSKIEKRNMDILKLELLSANNEQEHLQLMAHMASLASENERKAAREEQLQAQKDLNEMKLKRLKAENTRLEIAYRNKQAKYNNLIIISIAITIFICLIIMSIWLERSRKNSIKLAKLSDEFEAEKNIAMNTSKMKTLFIQNMNHEIRTPLNTVTGFAQILASNEIPITEEERIEYGNHITNHSKALNVLIDDILNIADIESGKFVIYPRKHNLENIIQSVLEAVNYQKTSDVDIILENNTDSSLCIMTDARRVQQVLTTFISNSCKTTVAGQILLQVDSIDNNKTICFAISDTSGLLQPETIEEIRRNLNNQNMLNSGFSLGLCICKMITERMNGEIYLDESYTEGSKYIFKLPLILPKE